MTIQLDTIIARNESILFSALDDEVLMMSIDNGEYYSTDEIGGRIWTMLDEPQSIVTLCHSLIEEYDIDLETCQHDVLEFANAMAKLDVITVLTERKS